MNESIYRKQFGGEHRFFYTPMPNPMSEATGLLDFIDEQKPEISEDKRPMVQVAHNSFFFNTFNNAIKQIVLCFCTLETMKL